MVVRVFVSNTSGNKEIKTQQDFVRHVLGIRKIEYVEVDISDAANEEQKMFMRETAKAKDGQNVPMPPQIYNDDNYCGNYEMFLEANECDEIFEFLQLAPAKSTSEAEVSLEPVTTPDIIPESPEVVSNDQVLQSKITIKLVSPEQSAD